jgi:CDP-6-deoxy-D-xylo-4-hexulose-3-dehydrase
MQLVEHLQKSGAECRPIVTGNFAKNPVVQWFSYEIQGELPNANWIDQHGLFVGNHQVPIPDALRRLRKTIDAL